MKKISLILGVIVTFISCSKEGTPTSLGSPTVSNTGTPSSTITPIPLQNFSNASFAFFTQQTLLGTNPATFKSICNGQVTFFAGTSNSNSSKVTVKGVYLDSVPLSLNTSAVSYSSSYIAAGNSTWQIYGSGNIPSFTYADSLIPALVNYTALPDTIDHTQPLSVFIQFSMGHAYGLTIFSANNHSINAASSIYATDTANVSFTAASMNNLTVGTGTLSLDADYVDQESVNGIPMLFYNKKTFNKVIYIK